MTNFREVFPNPPVILPVVHIQSREHAIQNTRVALESGSDGVFLIDLLAEEQGGPRERLFDAYKEVRKSYPHEFIGLNFVNWPIGWKESNLRENLGDLSDLFSTLEELRVSGLFVQNYRFLEHDVDQPYVEVINEAREGSDVVCFGGLAFHNPGVDEYRLTSTIARHLIDVVVTGGVDRGIPPTEAKVTTLRKAIGKHPLGVSSGISPENILDYPMVDCFMANTHIVYTGTEDLNPHLLGVMVMLGRKYLPGRLRPSYIAR